MTNNLRTELPAIGDVLRNGSTVLATRHNDLGDGVVLAMLGPNDRSILSNFATWYLNSEGLTWCGDYFAELDPALRDYRENRG
jgi:hypothetical protein